MSYKPLFSRFLGADPDRLHFAAHSHHPWPDITLDAHKRAWEDAARLMDDKWDVILGEVVPAVRERIGSVLGLPEPDTIVFAPNTHELVARVVSCLELPASVLTTDAEFHSFARQLGRWEEAGRVTVERVAAEPFATFPDRFAAAAARGGHDLVYLSHVFFDSGYVVGDLERLVAAVPSEDSFVVVDGYHAFLALPVDVGPIAERVFYVAGGYKYAMSGEGVCFLHAPPGYGMRPVDTGWYAGFAQLEGPDAAAVAFAKTADRFWGATFDASGLYRMLAVLDLLAEEEISPAAIHGHVRALQERFLAASAAARLDLGTLVPAREVADRGNFLVFRRPDAAEVYESLRRAGVVTDRRADRLRIGFGIYHDPGDVDELVDRMLSAT